MSQCKINDTDYLFLATRVRALERELLSKGRMDRMLEAPTAEEAAKILTECGYPEMARVDVNTLNTALAARRDQVFEDLYALAPDPAIIDVFRVKYDYHNAKALLKAGALGLDCSHLMVEAGRIPTQELAEKITSSELVSLPPVFRTAVEEARNVLGSTGDPQLCDFVLDSACFAEMSTLAEGSGSQFLLGYIRMLVDAANLKSVIRARRMEKGTDFLAGVLFSGGDVAESRLLAAGGGENIAELYAATPFRTAAEAGTAVLSGASLTLFEKECDNAVQEYLSTARYVAFGEAPVVAYLAARENEQIAIRIIMTGRLAGLPPEQIRERLRDAYV